MGVGSVGFTEAVKSVLSKYADFSGRARRSEYWFWGLATILGYMVALILTAIAKPFTLLAIIFYLGILVPSIAVGARRLHDTGKSGWWLLISVVPLIGGIVLLVFTVTDSAPGSNQYGPNPKGVVGPGGMPTLAYGQLPPA